MATAKTPPKGKHRIFIVDDHPIFRQGLAQLINQESDLLVCGEAEDYQSALKAAQDLKPDMIIVDITLKNMSGIDLIKEIHKTRRDLAMAGLMLYCGLRSCEVLALAVTDVDIGGRWVTVTGKGAKQRRVPLDPDVASVIDVYVLAERPESASDRLFLVAKGPNRGQPLTAAGLRTVFRYHREVSGVTGGHPHALRHTFGTALAEAGVDFLDAPVSGGRAGAEQATLSIMVGGDEAVFEKARPIFEIMGKPTYCGPSGSGQIVKACNQIVQVVNIQGIAEAMLFANANGVDGHKVVEALMSGFAGSKMLGLMGPKMANRDFDAGIEARLHHKDFGLVLEAARKSGVPVPLTATVAQQLNALMAQGWGKMRAPRSSAGGLPK